MRELQARQSEVAAAIQSARAAAEHAFQEHRSQLVKKNRLASQLHEVATQV